MYELRADSIGLLDDPKYRDAVVPSLTEKECHPLGKFVGELRRLRGEEGFEGTTVVRNLERHIGCRSCGLHEPHGSPRSGITLFHHEADPGRLRSVEVR